MNQENQSTTIQKTEPRTTDQKPPIQTFQFPVTPNVRVGSGFEVCGFGTGRLVCGNESDWKRFLLTLSASDLEMLSKLRREAYLEKFPLRGRKKVLLCRNVYRVFSDQDLINLFSVIPRKEVKFGLAFFLQATCGFRIGEVSPIKVKDIDFQRGVISLLTEKAQVISDQPVPDVALEVLAEWIQTNECEAKHNGFVFFSGNPLFARNFVSPYVIRNYFGNYRKKAGLVSTYAESRDKNNPKQKDNRQLFKLSTHSFRRSYLTRLYQECRKKELVSVLARHKYRDTTEQYIYFDHSEQLTLVNKVFDREPFKQIAEELIEKIRR